MSTSGKPCDFCGRKHRRGRANCAAWGCVCGACGKKNHFASHWKAKEKAHNVELEEGETSEVEFFYWVTSKPEMTSTVNSVSEPEIYAQMLINEQLIKFHIDCSVTVNVLPIKYVNKEDIHQTKRVLQLWNNTELKPEGICRVTIRNPRDRKKILSRVHCCQREFDPTAGCSSNTADGPARKVHEQCTKKTSEKWPQQE